VDVTEMVRKGPNILTVVEVQDLRQYVFCLFEKQPSKEELEFL
jgi:hypothetical protein